MRAYLCLFADKGALICAWEAGMQHMLRAAQVPRFLGSRRHPFSPWNSMNLAKASTAIRRYLAELQIYTSRVLVKF
jgi:hypothetical protein